MRKIKIMPGKEGKDCPANGTVLGIPKPTRTPYGLKRKISHNTAENSANIRQYYS